MGSNPTRGTNILADRMVSEHNPFLYLIGWTDLTAWYVGVRYSRECQPFDLWTNYFTSSKMVKLFREEFGEPDVVCVLATGSKEEVLGWEEQLIIDLKLYKDPKWLNLGVGGRKFHNTGASEETRAKMRISAATRKRLSDETKRHLSEQTKRSWQKTDKGLRDRRLSAIGKPGSDRSFTAWGETKSQDEWLKQYVDISAQQFRVRINLGWSVEDALTRTPRPRRRAKYQQNGEDSRLPFAPSRGTNC